MLLLHWASVLITRNHRTFSVLEMRHLSVEVVKPHRIVFHISLWLVKFLLLVLLLLQLIHYLCNTPARVSPSARHYRKLQE